MRLACFLITTLALADTAPIADENLRMDALRAIFPGMQISLVPGKRVADAPPKKPGPYELDSPDALARENVYRVIGKATNQAEQCAAENLQVSGTSSETRLLRFQLFRWPKDNGLLAVLQYKFEGASPAGACWSVGLLIRLEHAAETWRIGDRNLLETMHHTSLQTVRMLDLNGDGVDELAIESDSGGAGTWSANLLVFDLARLTFQEVFGATSRISYLTDDMYKQALDAPRTIERHGDKFCFIKTTMIEAEETFRPPRVTKPCYPPNEGDERNIEAEERNKLLAPLSRP
jgi:hypothetical protein